MARGLNKVTLIGNLGKDPEIRQTQNGGMVAKLNVGITDRRKDSSTGQYAEVTEWVTCVGFNRTAELLAEYTKVGSRLYVEGPMRTRSYEKDGSKRYVTEVIIDNMMFLDAKPSAPSPAPAPAPTPAQQSQGFPEDDIPF